MLTSKEKWLQRSFGQTTCIIEILLIAMYVSALPAAVFGIYWQHRKYLNNALEMRSKYWLHIITSDGHTPAVFVFVDISTSPPTRLFCTVNAKNEMWLDSGQNAVIRNASCPYAKGRMQGHEWFDPSLSRISEYILHFNVRCKWGLCWTPRVALLDCWWST